MTRKRALVSVAHNIAHHAQSHFSSLHPGLFAACREVGRTEAEIELLVEDPYPGGIPEYEPLRLAFAALRERFWQILESEGFGRTSVAAARLKFHFPERLIYPHYGNDGTVCEVVGKIISPEGTVYESIVRWHAVYESPVNGPAV
jgi:hypothetical protein